MSWFAKLVAGFDALRGRWSPVVLEDQASLAEAEALLRRVREHELHRASGSGVTATAAYQDQSVDNVMVGVRDGADGPLVATLRVVPAAQLAASTAAQRAYCLDLMPSDVLDLTSVYTTLVVAPEARRTAASILAMQHASEVGVRRFGYQMIVFAAEPALFPLYRRLGFRPLGRIHPSASGGFRIPMVGLYDKEHRRTLHGPIRRIADRLATEDGERLAEWYRQLDVSDVGLDLVGPDDAADVPLTRNLSSRGRRALLSSAVRLRPEQGDVIVKAGDGGRNIYVVESGVVTAQRGHDLLATMGQGEVFRRAVHVAGCRPRRRRDRSLRRRGAAPALPARPGPPRRPRRPGRRGGGTSPRSWPIAW